MRSRRGHAAALAVGILALSGCWGDPTNPPPVTGLQATATTTTASLSWTNPPWAFWGARVYRSDGFAPPASPEEGDFVGDAGGGSSLTDRGLTPGATYSYSVIVHGADGYHSVPTSITIMTEGGALASPGDTSSIALVSSTTAGGWTYDFYRNSAYPCSISGYQTFVIATKVGSSPTAPAPLWAFLHGGGAGYFDASGAPIPSAGQKSEEGATGLRNRLIYNGLLNSVRNDAAGFRTLAVSYCSHDVYSGTSSPDPHNPNTWGAGQPRPTTGLYATKAAIQFAQSLYPTTKTFLHGNSAGSVGSVAVAWSMQRQGIPPAGVVADASVVNTDAFAAAFAAGYCTESNAPDQVAAIAARVNPDLAAPFNEADRLVTSGRLTVPLLHLWNHGDSNTCGSPPITCPVRGGSTVVLGLTDCIHEPLRRAIDSQGPTSRSRNLGVCVDSDATPDCSLHVVTIPVGLTNTDPTAPADYLAAIVDWVHDRLADPS